MNAASTHSAVPADAAICSMETVRHISIGAHMRILIADDSNTIGKRLQRLLQQLPFVRSVVYSPSIATAITGAEFMQPDVLILDHHFPEGRGLDVLESLRDTIPGTEVIVFSAFATSIDHEAYRRLGVKAVLDKTGDVGLLMDLLTEMHDASLNSERS